MFWIIVLTGVAGFVAWVGWVCRPRGSATGQPTSDLDTNVLHARWKARGDTSWYDL